MTIRPSTFTLNAASSLSSGLLAAYLGTGTLWDAMAWSRALSAAEVSALYSNPATAGGLVQTFNPAWASQCSLAL